MDRSRIRTVAAFALWLRAALTRLAVAESRRRGVLVGAGLFAFAVLSRLALGLEGFAFLTFSPVVAITTLVGGGAVGAGFAVLCGLTAWVFILPPAGSFAIATANDALALGGFALVATLLVLLVDQLSSALRDAETARTLATDALAGQRAMFREFQHRVANSLQTSASVLSMEQRRSAKAGMTEAAGVLGEAVRRLNAMAGVHRRLHDLEANGDDFQRVIEDVCAELGQAFGATGVRFVVEVKSAASLDINRLLTLALVITESVTNSLKHAFSAGQDGKVLVRLTRNASDYELVVRDDGPGFPEQSLPPTVQCQNLGTLVMQALVRQLGGLVERANEDGAVLRLTFPADRRQGVPAERR